MQIYITIRYFILESCLKFLCVVYNSQIAQILVGYAKLRLTKTLLLLARNVKYDRKEALIELV